MLPLLTVALLIQAEPVERIDSAIAYGIEAGSYPGAVVVVGRSNTVLLAKGYGHFSWSPESRVPDVDSTVWDLASLTKVVATTPAIMRLVDQGSLDLDDPVQTYLPGFRGEGKEVVTVRHLLEHRSGLRAFLPLNDRAETGEEAMQLVLNEPLRWSPGSRVEYSDLNAMLLGWIVEGVSGMSLADYSESRIFSELGMTQTRFRPPRSIRPRMAPVGLWRGHVIAGELHDQNAVRLGGVSGHAGLYSTGSDLVRYAQLYLLEGRDSRGKELYPAEIVREFIKRGPGNRALGWEVRDTTDEANTGSLLSERSFGHGGYTGTSIWIDPERDLFVIILTNRVFAPRTRRSITVLKAVRARVADAAVGLLAVSAHPSSRLRRRDAALTRP
jgi:CubicO group peptidase (beta-lactamase class C family)